MRGVDPAAVEAEFAEARYGDFKMAVAAAVVDYLAPVRERYTELRADEAALEPILRRRRQRARAIAARDARRRARAHGRGGAAPREAAPRRGRSIRCAHGRAAEIAAAVSG